MKFDFSKKGPCFRCFMPDIPDFENNCQSDGIFSPVAGIMGTLQANEVLKTILNKEIDIIKEDYIWINNFEPFLNDKIVLAIYKKL